MVIQTEQISCFFSNFQGLFPSHHGIVANRFTDKTLNDSFRIGGPSSSDPKWWGGEPVSKKTVLWASKVVNSANKKSINFCLKLTKDKGQTNRRILRTVPTNSKVCLRDLLICGKSRS